MSARSIILRHSAFSSSSRTTLNSVFNRPALRTFSTSSLVRSSKSDSPFDRPGPPPLPKEEQAEFNRLVRERGNQLQFSRPPDSKSTTQPSSSPSQSKAKQAVNASGDPLVHPNARNNPKSDFEGDTNPDTGEVGGPKKNPLQWEREWTYGGRATDF